MKKLSERTQWVKESDLLNILLAFVKSRQNKKTKKKCFKLLDFLLVWPYHNFTVNHVWCVIAQRNTRPDRKRKKIQCRKDKGYHLICGSALWLTQLNHTLSSFYGNSRTRMHWVILKGLCNLKPGGMVANGYGIIGTVLLNINAQNMIINICLGL